MLLINARTLSEFVIVEFGDTGAELSQLSYAVFMPRKIAFRLAHFTTKIASKLSLALNLKSIKCNLYMCELVDYNTQLKYCIKSAKLIEM